MAHPTRWQDTQYHLSYDDHTSKYCRSSDMAHNTTNTSQQDYNSLAKRQRLNETKRATKNDKSNNIERNVTQKKKKDDPKSHISCH